MQIVLSKIVINVIVMWIILSFGLAFDAWNEVLMLQRAHKVTLKKKSSKKFQKSQNGKIQFFDWFLNFFFERVTLFIPFLIFWGRCPYRFA